MMNTTTENKAVLLDYIIQIQAAAKTLDSIGHNQRPEVSAQDALAALEEIPKPDRGKTIDDAITTLERCVMAKQHGRELDVLASNL